MGDMLSQDEINALFNTTDDDAPKAPAKAADDADDKSGELKGYLSDQDKDILGEVGNISMGTAASTLNTLLSQRVEITTPQVRVVRWSEVAKSYDRPCVGIRVNYVEGLEGVNVLVLKERDVKIISDLMMGGTGTNVAGGEITDLDLSAITECMNQMIGSSSTSMSSLVKTRIDIDTPNAFLLDFNDDNFFDSVKFTGDVIACIKFRMEIGNLIDSEIMQIWPLDFAKNIVETFMSELNAPPKASTVATAPPRAQAPAAAKPAPAPHMETAPAVTPPPREDVPPAAYPYGYPPPPPYGYGYAPQPARQPVNAQPVQFESFDIPGMDGLQKENIDIIMDVPLDVTVELGRTTKKIKEILEFQPGSIVELNKLAGETMDIMINGKFVARGEVVVIDENFAVRIIDIVNADNRI